MWAKRQNHTFRPSRPVTAQEEAQAVSSSKNFQCYVFHYFINSRLAVKSLMSLIFVMITSLLTMVVRDFED